MKYYEVDFYGVDYCGGGYRDTGGFLPVDGFEELFCTNDYEEALNEFKYRKEYICDTGKRLGVSLQKYDENDELLESSSYEFWEKGGLGKE